MEVDIKLTEEVPLLFNVRAELQICEWFWTSLEENKEALNTVRDHSEHQVLPGKT